MRYNGDQARLADYYLWIRVSLSASYFRPCATTKQHLVNNYIITIKIIAIISTFRTAFIINTTIINATTTNTPDIGLAVRVFANGPGDLGSVPGRVIPKSQKMVLDASLLNTQHYKVRIKGKVEQSREGVAPSPTPWCSSYRKGSLRVTLDYGRQLYLLLLLNYYY